MELLIFTLVLSIDSFSAALALGFRRFSHRRALFFALSSGFSEGFAIFLGFLLGRIAENFIVNYDHWVAFFLLCAVGGHMCYQSYQEMRSSSPRETHAVKVHGLLKILFVSSVTSIDSLGVGVTLGLIGKPVALYSLVIGIGAFLSTYLGLFLAKRISGHLGEKVEFLGGVILILLGIKMLSI
ncbi:manganese efflux pump MntP family protein [Trichothermofontia sichuanensis B231]|uniref:manganese efflux pump MntP n=1 Tax=Trichothermofontia sichuanensis TaxID=3045816 RepID=UPI0022473FBC|nr:manganese efflux pump [Trichothermofontia sichuanensis]UZQ54472.1 manganese efflux pump MntP family protein [Trichothermofontia sichuanensis B231]